MRIYHNVVIVRQMRENLFTLRSVTVTDTEVTQCESATRSNGHVIRNKGMRGLFKRMVGIRRRELARENQILRAYAQSYKKAINRGRRWQYVAWFWIDPAVCTGMYST